MGAEPVVVHHDFAGNPIRIFLCDDVPELRGLIRRRLEQDPGLRVVGEAGDGNACLAGIPVSGAEVVVLDLSMPELDGLEALSRLRGTQPELGILVLSGFAAHRMAAQALTLGADAYLEKGTPLVAVRDTVRQIGFDVRARQSTGG